MSIPQPEWRIRAIGQNPTFADLYGSNFNTKFTSLEIYHGGKFTPTPKRDYINGKITIVDFVEVHKLSFALLSEIVKALDCNGTPSFYFFVEKKFGLDLGLMKLGSEHDFEKFKDIIFPTKCNQLHRVYVEVDRKSHVASFPNSLKKAPKEVIEKMLLHFAFDHPRATLQEARNFVFEEYGVWITPFILRPAFQSILGRVYAFNGDC